MEAACVSADLDVLYRLLNVLEVDLERLDLEHRKLSRHRVMPPGHAGHAGALPGPFRGGRCSRPP